MVISERSRHDLYEAAKRGLGPEAAETLMELMPPVGWAEVATKQDLAALQAATKQDLAMFQAATKQDFVRVGQDIQSLEATTKQAIQNLQEATRKDLAILEHTMRGEMEKLRGDLMAQMVVQTRTMVLSFAGSVVALAGIAFGAAGIA